VGKKILGVILLTLAVILAFPCLMGIMRLSAGLMSILFSDPEAANKISLINIVSTIVLSGVDITLLVYGTRFIKKPGVEQQTEEKPDNNNPI
jgi:hypothetical protein